MSQDERQFPVLGAGRSKVGFSSVPWGFLAPHEARAQANHHQSLNRLAERGGLCPAEMLAVVENLAWHEVEKLEDYQVRLRLTNLLADYIASMSAVV